MPYVLILRQIPYIALERKEENRFMHIQLRRYRRFLTNYLKPQHRHILLRVYSLFDLLYHAQISQNTISFAIQSSAVRGETRSCS